MKALIIDDEPHAREGIKLRLDKFDTIKVMGECADGKEALNRINRIKPDLIFLDIQMPGMNGFELLKNIEPGKLPMVIFITAFDQHAIKAFEFHAIDYLLKPVNVSRFRKSVENAISVFQKQNLELYTQRLEQLIDSYGRSAADVYSNRNTALTRIPVKTRENVYFVDAADIEFIESAGDYVYLHADNKKHLIRDSLASLANKLDSRIFIRIHRSSIVNINHIENMRSADHGDYFILMKDGSKLKLSRNYKTGFEKVIGYSI